MANLPLYVVTILGLLAVLSPGCARVLPHRTPHRRVQPTCAVPQSDRTSFEPVLPVPQSCQRTSVSSDARFAGQVPPPPLPRILEASDKGLTNDLRLTQMESELRLLREQVRKQQDLVSEADGSITDDSLEFRMADLQRVLAEIRQAQAETQLQMTRNSQKLTELATVQESDRREHARVLDEIIAGLEQALSPFEIQTP